MRTRKAKRRAKRKKKATARQAAATQMLSQARAIFKQAGSIGGQYRDLGRVRTASGLAYQAVEWSLDEFLRRQEGENYTKPAGIDAYRERLQAHAPGLLPLLNDAYAHLYLRGYYYGTASTQTIKTGLKMAEQLISSVLT